MNAVKTVYHPVNGVNNHVDKADDAIKRSLCNRHKGRKDALKDFLNTCPCSFPVPREYATDEIDNTVKNGLYGIPNRLYGSEKDIKDFTENTKGL